MAQITSDSLNDLQAYFQKVLKERGFNDETLAEKIMLLTEEVGEVARAVRKHSAVKMSDTTRRSDVSEEAADVIILIIDICNQLGINIFDAIVAKEAINETRTWL